MKLKTMLHESPSPCLLKQYLESRISNALEISLCIQMSKNCAPSILATLNMMAPYSIFLKIFLQTSSSNHKEGMSLQETSPNKPLTSGTRHSTMHKQPHNGVSQWFTVYLLQQHKHQPTNEKPLFLRMRLSIVRIYPMLLST